MDAVCATGLAPDKPLSPRDGRGSDYAPFTPFQEVCICQKRVEEVTGIEPALPAWEAGVLPIDDTSIMYPFAIPPLRHSRHRRRHRKSPGRWADLPPRLVAVIKNWEQCTLLCLHTDALLHHHHLSFLASWPESCFLFLLCPHRQHQRCSSPADILHPPQVLLLTELRPVYPDHMSGRLCMLILIHKLCTSFSLLQSLRTHACPGYSTMYQSSASISL